MVSSPSPPSRRDSIAAQTLGKRHLSRYLSRRCGRTENALGQTGETIKRSNEATRAGAPAHWRHGGLICPPPSAEGDAGDRLLRQCEARRQSTASTGVPRERNWLDRGTERGD